jgi:hypothetical protein
MSFEKSMSNPAVGPTDGRRRASAAIPSRGHMRHPHSGEAKKGPARLMMVYRGDAADTIARAGLLLHRVIHLVLTENKGAAR